MSLEQVSALARAQSGHDCLLEKGRHRSVMSLKRLDLNLPELILASFRFFVFELPTAWFLREVLKISIEEEGDEDVEIQMVRSLEPMEEKVCSTSWTTWIWFRWWNLDDYRHALRNWNELVQAKQKEREEAWIEEIDPDSDHDSSRKTPPLIKVKPSATKIQNQPAKRIRKIGRDSMTMTMPRKAESPPLKEPYVPKYKKRPDLPKLVPTIEQQKPKPIVVAIAESSRPVVERGRPLRRRRSPAITEMCHKFEDVTVDDAKKDSPSNGTIAPTQRPFSTASENPALKERGEKSSLEVGGSGINPSASSSKPYVPIRAYQDATNFHRFNSPSPLQPPPLPPSRPSLTSSNTLPSRTVSTSALNAFDEKESFGRNKCQSNIELAGAAAVRSGAKKKSSADRKKVEDTSELVEKMIVMDRMIESAFPQVSRSILI